MWDDMSQLDEEEKILLIFSNNSSNFCILNLAREGYDMRFMRYSQDNKTKRMNCLLYILLKMNSKIEYSGNFIALIEEFTQN